MTDDGQKIIFKNLVNARRWPADNPRERETKEELFREVTMNELFALAMAKFPPSRIPAMLEEMRGGRESILQRASPEAQEKYLAVLDAGAGVETMLAASKAYDVLLVDQDLDDSGYGFLDACAAIERIYAGRQVPLTEEEEELRQSARELVAALFPKGNEILRYSHLAEWSEIKTLLQRAALSENAKKIERLGLSHIISRMQRCHQLLGEILGIHLTGEIQQEGVARFESAFGELVSVVVLQYAKDTDAERQMRELLLGPFKRHLEAYRDEQRRRALRAQAKQTEITSKISITPNAD
jgi:hypothetical protein